MSRSALAIFFWILFGVRGLESSRPSIHWLAIFFWILCALRWRVRTACRHQPSFTCYFLLNFVRARGGRYEIAEATKQLAIFFWILYVCVLDIAKATILVLYLAIFFWILLGIAYVLVKSRSLARLAIFFWILLYADAIVSKKQFCLLTCYFLLNFVSSVGLSHPYHSKNVLLAIFFWILFKVPDPLDPNNRTIVLLLFSFEFCVEVDCPRCGRLHRPCYFLLNFVSSNIVGWAPWQYHQPLAIFFWIL